MTYTYRQPGDLVTVPAPTGGVVSGRPVAIGSLIGVATATVAAGEKVAISCKGIHELPKKTGESWAVGDVIYYDKVANKCSKTAPSTETFTLGVATAAKLTSDTTGDVRLNQ